MVETTNIISAKETPIDRKPTLTIIIQFRFKVCLKKNNFYEWVSSTFSLLYHEAPFLKTTLAVFDLPGIIGSTHIAIQRQFLLMGIEYI